LATLDGFLTQMDSRFEFIIIENECEYDSCDNGANGNLGVLASVDRGNMPHAKVAKNAMKATKSLRGVAFERIVELCGLGVLCVRKHVSRKARQERGPARNRCFWLAGFERLPTLSRSFAIQGILYAETN
jgi:hypothetical protein